MCNACHGPCRITPDGKVKNHWYDKEPGYVKAEIKAALRPTVVLDKPRGKVDQWGVKHYPPLNYKLPGPTLDASHKRLCKAEVWCENNRWEGALAAEQYVAFRRAQLGLDLDAAQAA